MKNSCFFTGLFPGGTRLFQRCTGFSWQNEDENWIPHGEPPPRARRPPPTHRTSGPPSRHGGVPRASDPPESVCTRQKGRRVASAQRAADAADGSDSAGAAHGGEEWKATHHSSRLSSSTPVTAPLTRSAARTRAAAARRGCITTCRLTGQGGHGVVPLASVAWRRLARGPWDGGQAAEYSGQGLLERGQLLPWVHRGGGRRDGRREGRTAARCRLARAG